MYLLMKKLQYIVLVITLVIAGAQTSLQARQGDSCGDPIQLYPEFSQTIMQAGSYWYVANTTDLPMTITFHPGIQSAQAPHVELDFGCTPGYYDDPILCNLFCVSKPAYISLPYSQDIPKAYDDDGNVIYRVEFGEFYRDMLYSQGISYNVPVYIHATFYCGGVLEMTPDAFGNCMDGAKFMQLGDTVQVEAADTKRHVVVPYIQWKMDSIRYVWHGSKDCILAVGSTCDINPLDAEDSHIIDGGPDHPIAPGGQLKVSSELIKKYLAQYQNEAGMFYAKFYSEEPGYMKIERIPAPAPGCGAKLMRLGELTQIERNDIDAVYAIPSSWDESMQFTSPTSHILKMYVGKTCDFALEDAIAVYQYDRITNGHQLDMLGDELKALWEQKLKTENYLYIRFECSDETTVRPALWTPSDCEENTQRMTKGQREQIGAKSKVVYSLYYPDWKGGDLSLSWDNTQSNCTFYIADTCQVPNNANAPVFYSETIGKRATFTVPQATVDSWESKADPDGYIYIRFYSQAKSYITISSTAPEEEDNPCETYTKNSELVAFDSVLWRGQMYYESGVYKAYGTLDPETNCYDSIFTLDLNVRHTTHETITEAACDSFVYNSKTYRESGTYSDTILITAGNRKITTLELTINHSTEASRTVMQYDPFTTASGKVLTESGVYLDTITNAAGCDSVITYNLTIYTTGEVVIEESGCDSIVIEGERYTESGEYVDTLDIPGGGRVIRTLRLTIGHTSYATENPKACGSYTSPRGVQYTESGDYTEKLTNVSGCDSIISLHVTIGKTTYGELTFTRCVQYTSPWGKVYTESGDYTETGTNVAGCDSVVTLHLTIIPDCNTYDTAYFCRGFNSEHEELMADGMIRRYRPYVFESPAEWDFMEGVIVEREHDRTLVDLRRAEANLYAHYVGERTPISSIRWSVQYDGKGQYEPLAVTNEPQWIAAGHVAVQISFLCGELYNTEFPTDIDHVSQEAVSVKRIENGRVVIIRGGAKYDMFGTKIQ